MPPKKTLLEQGDTRRLIPNRFFEGESVLSRLGLPPAQMSHLYQLDDATNDRLAGEAGRLPGISVHELVFGVPHFHIVNASFTHAQPHGSRFSGPDRGVWYAGFSLKTAQTEVAFHYATGLREINWQEEEAVSYREYLADFRGDFHDLRNDPASKKYLQPNNYRASQRLGRQLLERGSSGVVYPSVRHAGGTCIACFRPALVSNVRDGALVTFTFPDATHPPKVRVSRKD
ncbi:MAG: RES family NAD+ phosphorylase [Acidobacteria bacterium]|nr:RES family NAD+ phosphorylase [Acidobacteriota bacterium]